MSKLIPGNHSHLTLEDRLYIEEALNERKSFREIAKYLCKNPSTISKEVWNNRVVNTYHRGSYINPHNFCVHRFRCKKINACNKIEICDRYCKSCLRCNSVCPRFEREECRQIKRAPYVCNGCDKARSRCSIQTKYDYNAKAADRQYRERLVDSRSGVNLTKKEGQTYYLDKKTGEMKTGWQTIDKKKFYFDTKKKTKGQMVTGWLTIGKKKYYLSPKTKTLGQMVTGTLKIRKKTYKFNKSGVCLNP